MRSKNLKLNFNLYGESHLVLGEVGPSLGPRRPHHRHAHQHGMIAHAAHVNEAPGLIVLFLFVLALGRSVAVAGFAAAVLLGTVFVLLHGSV